MYSEWRKLRRRWKKVILTLAELGGKASFKQLKEKTRYPPSTLAYVLEILKKRGLIRALSKGEYKLRYLTPLIFINKDFIKKKSAYLGLLGLKMEREYPEYRIAIKQLRKEGYGFKKKMVATTLKALQDWGEMVVGEIDFLILKEKQLFNPRDVEKILKNKVIELIEEYFLLVDITSGPRTAAIALFKISIENHVPIVYVREDTGQLIWISHPRDLLFYFLR